VRRNSVAEGRNVCGASNRRYGNNKQSLRTAATVKCVMELTRSRGDSDGSAEVENSAQGRGPPSPTMRSEIIRHRQGSVRGDARQVRRWRESQRQCGASAVCQQCARSVDRIKRYKCSRVSRSARCPDSRAAPARRASGVAASRLDSARKVRYSVAWRHHADDRDATSPSMLFVIPNARYGTTAILYNGGGESPGPESSSHTDYSEHMPAMTEHRVPCR